MLIQPTFGLLAEDYCHILKWSTETQDYSMDHTARSTLDKY